jgi:hypothetical protein
MTEIIRASGQGIDPVTPTLPGQERVQRRVELIDDDGGVPRYAARPAGHLGRGPVTVVARPDETDVERPVGQRSSRLTWHQHGDLTVPRGRPGEGPDDV